MDVKSAKLVLKGKVQGVFFREFAKQNANKLGIVGYARNTKEGALEIVAQGDERKLEEFIRLCKRGPIFAKVESATVDYGGEGAEQEEYEYFDIRHS
jgi:acylphosphatase